MVLFHVGQQALGDIGERSGGHGKSPYMYWAAYLLEIEFTVWSRIPALPN